MAEGGRQGQRQRGGRPPTRPSPAAAGATVAQQAEGDGKTQASFIEGRVNQLLLHLQPSFASEVRRLSVAEFVCNVIRRCFYPQQVEAFMFGSVPLRTVLPDGDIDISVFCPAVPGAAGLRETWAMELLRALEREQTSPSQSLFTVSDVHYIQADVRLVKCIVADLVVDISFDTLGGLCTVAFLEAVDRRVGLGHLFKRSIVLVKAWCYYEGRLLGAHHGLISSYALETMVLHVLNLHHRMLRTPLEVLRKFLEVFSSFDWEEYCLSVHGPIPIRSFPNPTVDCSMLPPSSPLLDSEFMADALCSYSVRPPASSSGGSSNADGPLGLPPVAAPAFPLKHLNVVDPLLPTNNLGRSVSRASFARIRQAFAQGLRALDEAVAKGSSRMVVDAVDLFFKNTWRSPMRTSADNQLFLRRLEAATTGFVAPAAYTGVPRTGTLDSIAAQVLVAQQQQKQQQHGGYAQLMSPMLAEAREGSLPPAPGMPPLPPRAPLAASGADVPSRGQVMPQPVAQAVLPAYAALLSPGLGLPQPAATTSHVLGPLHGLLNSGALPDPLAGDLATLSRNLHIARLSQQQQQ